MIKLKYLELYKQKIEKLINIHGYVNFRYLNILK